MADTNSRLSSCFGAVFPELPADQLVNASASSIASWDSVATITLFSVIEEEFGITIAPEEIPDLVSYELILDYLSGRLRGSVA